MAPPAEDLVAKERELLARALREAVLSPRAAGGAGGGPPKRKRKGRGEVSEVVERTWVSAGCFGEAVQWKLKPRSGP